MSSEQDDERRDSIPEEPESNQQSNHINKTNLVPNEDRRNITYERSHSLVEPHTNHFSENT